MARALLCFLRPWPSHSFRLPPGGCRLDCQLEIRDLIALDGAVLPAGEYGCLTSNETINGFSLAGCVDQAPRAGAEQTFIVGTWAP